MTAHTDGNPKTYHWACYHCGHPSTELVEGQVPRCPTCPSGKGRGYMALDGSHLVWFCDGPCVRDFRALDEKAFWVAQALAAGPD